MKQHITELTFRGIVLAIILTVILAMANAFLALKLGILTSASIPAAILSMGILSLFKHSSILENNLVQTAASAGEAVAGGIVYTIPALIIIGFWHHFDYVTNFMIALIGGVLGVMFSIPLRRHLVHDESLKFPEGRAIAEVLKSSEKRAGGMQDILFGGVAGVVLELFQSGFKIIASQWQVVKSVKGTVFGFGGGFSTTMFAAGYLVGFDMAMSIFIGALIAWILVLPITSQIFSPLLSGHPLAQGVSLLWDEKIRYVGIGSMLFAGVLTLFHLIRPLAKSMRASWHARQSNQPLASTASRVEQDIPLSILGTVTLVTAVGLYVLFKYTFPLEQLGLASTASSLVLNGSLLYVLLFGFLFSVITAYFSGMVGVTASPGSSVVIAGILFASSLLLLVLKTAFTVLSDEQIMAAEAVVIIIGAVVTGIAAIANDNTQDLKVGQLVGATPWKQELMLLLGVLVAALVIPPVMQILFNAYGIAGIMPRAGMDTTQSLPAPTAALLAAIAKAVLNHDLPWDMMGFGAVIMAVILGLNRLLNLGRFIQLSLLGVAVGMYLPISTSSPLFLGGLLAWFVERRLQRQGYPAEQVQSRKQTGTLIACGLVAGAALFEVILAVPSAIHHSPDVLRLVGPAWAPYGVGLGVLSLLGLAIWVVRRVCEK